MKSLRLAASLAASLTVKKAVRRELVPAGAGLGYLLSVKAWVSDRNQCFGGVSPPLSLPVHPCCWHAVHWPESNWTPSPSTFSFLEWKAVRMLVRTLGFIGVLSSVCGRSSEVA